MSDKQLLTFFNHSPELNERFRLYLNILTYLKYHKFIMIIGFDFDSKVNGKGIAIGRQIRYHGSWNKYTVQDIENSKYQLVDIVYNLHSVEYAANSNNLKIGTRVWSLYPQNGAYSTVYYPATIQGKVDDRCIIKFTTGIKCVHLQVFFDEFEVSVPVPGVIF